VFTQLGLYLRYLGFMSQTSPSGLKYWLREHTSSTEDLSGNAPVAVFAHGMGIGLSSYMFTFLPELLRLQRISKVGAVVLLTQPQVSMDPLGIENRGWGPTDDELVETLKSIASAHGPPTKPDHASIDSAPLLLMGHSYGSFLCARAVRQCPSGLLRGVVFLDPLCFLLHLHHVTELFCYQDQPVWPLTSEKSIAQLVRNERLTSTAMRRHFRWYHNALYMEDLATLGLLGHRNDKGGSQATRSLVFIAENDDKFAVPKVVAYLKKPVECEGIDSKLSIDLVADLVVMPGTAHGDVVLQAEETRKAFAKIEALIDSWGSSTVCPKHCED